MSSLQQRIKRLETNMNTEKVFFRHNSLLLKQRVTTPAFLVSTVAGMGLLSWWVYHWHVNKSVKVKGSSNSSANFYDFVQTFFKYLAPAARFILPLLLV